MGLRRQLFFLSLFTLVLPWAGIQFIQEMENTLRSSQKTAMLATARVIASRISSDSQLIDQIDTPQNSSDPGIYSHPLPTTMVLDGYDDDWRALTLQAVPLATVKPGENYRGETKFGATDTHYWLFVSVATSQINYQQATPPGPRPAPPKADHIVIHLKTSEGQSQEYVLYTTRPGTLSGIFKRTPAGLEPTSKIDGTWQENLNGYQLEIRWPKSGEMALSLEVLSGSARKLLVRSPTGFPVSDIQWASIISPKTAVNQAIAPLIEPGYLLSVVNADRWLIAEAGSLKRDTEKPVERTLFSWIYDLIISNEEISERSNPSLTGRMSSEEILSTINGIESSASYTQDFDRIDRVSVPLGHQYGAVIIEEKSDRILGTTGSAFSQLLLYSIIASVFAGISVLSYASWLSWRVRRLSTAADSAIDARGNIKSGFPESKLNDEIGKLSRHFNELLSRLSVYSEYQRSLSNKLSHELRTPLAVTKTSLDNLEQETDPDKLITYKQRAQEGISRLSEIITAMSSAHRVEAFIQQAEKEPVALNALLRELNDAYRDTFPHANFKLHLPEYTVSANVSPDLLVQQLDKLIENALDFVYEKGDITISVMDHRDKVSISVDNDGPLLPEAMQFNLFDSLVSVRQDSRKKNIHLGLGLHIVKLIGEFHEGSVRAENRADQHGVVFTIELPK